MQSQSVAQRRFSTALLSALAAIALALACLGIYSVMSYIVAERTPEVGIRMALGARAGQVQALVMARGLRLMVGGLVIGLVAAWVALRLLQASLATLLFRTQAGDGLTLTLVVLILAGIGVMASWIPARRAARVPPMSALRAE
jgi:ABC-type antimicrobial peptide transport system permease subunit